MHMTGYLHLELSETEKARILLNNSVLACNLNGYSLVWHLKRSIGKQNLELIN